MAVADTRGSFAREHPLSSLAGVEVVEDLDRRVVLRLLELVALAAEAAERLVTRNPAVARAARVVRPERAARLVQELRAMTERLARRFRAEPAAWGRVAPLVAAERAARTEAALVATQPRVKVAAVEAEAATTAAAGVRVGRRTSEVVVGEVDRAMLQVLRLP